MNILVTGAKCHLMAERTRYLKENPEGVSMMCKAMEEMRNNTVMETLISLVKKGLITAKDAAAEANMTESAFVTRMEASRG